MKVVVKRAFLIRGERQEPESIVEVDDAFGRELISLQKVAPVDPVEPQRGPMTTETAAAVVSGRKRKEKGNVQ